MFTHDLWIVYFTQSSNLVSRPNNTGEVDGCSFGKTGNIAMNKHCHIAQKNRALRSDDIEVISGN